MRTSREFKLSADERANIEKYCVNTYTSFHLSNQLSFFINHQKPTKILFFTLPQSKDFQEAERAAAAIRTVVVNDEKSEQSKILEPHVIILALERLIILRKEMLAANKQGSVLDKITEILNDYFLTLDTLEDDLALHREVIRQMSTVVYLKHLATNEADKLGESLKDDSDINFEDDAVFVSVSTGDDDSVSVVRSSAA